MHWFYCHLLPPGLLQECKFKQGNLGNINMSVCNHIRWVVATVLLTDPKILVLLMEYLCLQFSWAGYCAQLPGTSPLHTLKY